MKGFLKENLGFLVPVLLAVATLVMLQFVSCEKSNDLENTLDEVEDLKEKRNQYYPKELLYAKPLPGVVGFWYGLSTAISFDPDLVFVFTGNLPAFSLSEIPRSHFDELGIDAKYLSQTRMKGTGSAVNDLIKLTARKWLNSIERASALAQAHDAID